MSKKNVLEKDNVRLTNEVRKLKRELRDCEERERKFLEHNQIEYAVSVGQGVATVGEDHR